MKDPGLGRGRYFVDTGAAALSCVALSSWQTVKSIGIIIVLFCGIGALAAERGPPWKPERLPGSARLDWAAIRSLQLPPSAGSRLRAAATDFAHYFGIRFDRAPLRIVEARPGPAPKHALLLRLADWAPDDGGYHVARERSRLVLRARDTGGLVNAIYGVARSALGARWYWPGELGFEWIGPAPVRVAEAWRSVRPGFAMRWLHPSPEAFARRNRLDRGFSFRHNLARIFGAAAYAEHPEAFAELRGGRRPPRGSRKYDRQPDLTEPVAVELAATAARRHFTEHPERRSFSVSINDNVLFDTSDATRAAVAPLTYFRKKPNYTDLVFAFTNQVAEAVFADPAMRTTPGGKPRYLTALAYYWAEAAPGIEIHPRVIPVLTADRAQWHDPDYREEDRALIAAWATSGAERIATWDYYFGAPYPYPRQFNHWLDASLKHLHRSGVDLFFAQLPDAWGLDGPKAWLAAQLLWDPEADADALLGEFYEAFFGAAATAMRRFYETAEAWRNRHAGEAEWIKYYKDEAGIALFPEATLRRLRSALDAAAEAVSGDPKRAERVAVAAEAFRFTERYAALHRARTSLLESSFAVLADEAPLRRAAAPQEPTGESPLRLAAEAFKKAREAYEAQVVRLRGDERQGRLLDFTRLKQSDPLPIAHAALARQLGAAARVGEASPRSWRAAVRWVDPVTELRSVWNNPHLEHAAKPPERRSFLGPALPTIPGWHFDFRPSQHLAVAPASEDPSDRRGVRLSGSDMTSFFRDVPVVGQVDYLLDFDCSFAISPDNRSQLKLTWKDRLGNTLRVDLPLQFPWGRREDQRIVLPVQSPPNAYDLRIHFTLSRQYTGDFLELTRIALGRLVTP